MLEQFFFVMFLYQLLPTVELKLCLLKVHPHYPGGGAAASGGAGHGGHRVEGDLPPLPPAREARHSYSRRNSVSTLSRHMYLLTALRIRSWSESSILAEYRFGSRVSMTENWQKFTKNVFFDPKLLGIHLSLGIHKGRPIYRETFSPYKRTSST